EGGRGVRRGGPEPVRVVPDGADGTAARIVGRPCLYHESEVAVQKGGKLRLRQRTDLRGNDLSAAEQHQRRDAADAVFRRRGLVLVDVHLRDADLSFVLARHLVEDRRDHLAGTAPLGPVIDENRLLGLQDLLLERCVGYMLDRHSPSWIAALRQRPKHPPDEWYTCGIALGARAATARIGAGGPPRSAAWSTWSGPEGSSHSHFPRVPGSRLAHLAPQRAFSFTERCARIAFPDMTHLALARKWRPRDFDSLVGQA